MGSSANLASEIVNKLTDNNSIEIEFKKNILDNIFFKNLQILKDKSTRIPFKYDKWKFNPKKFCLDHYNNDIYYMIILLVNDIGSTFDFTSDSIKDRIILAPREDDILEILSYSSNF